jgi:hypothetical protein
LFTGKTIIALHKCRQNILKDDFDPVWMRSPDAKFLVYSLNTRKKFTRAGRTRFDFDMAGYFLLGVQTGSVAHPAFYPMVGRDDFPRE